MVSFCKRASAEGRDIVHPLPLPLRGALGCCKGVVRCKKAKCFFHSIEQNISHRAPTERIAQQQRKEKHSKTSLPQCIFTHFSNRRTTKNTHRTALFPSTAQAQARSAAHHVSSLYQPAQRSIHPRSKREGRLPPSLLPKPLFFFAPGACRRSGVSERNRPKGGS